MVRQFAVSIPHAETSSKNTLHQPFVEGGEDGRNEKFV